MVEEGRGGGLMNTEIFQHVTPGQYEKQVNKELYLVLKSISLHIYNYKPSDWKFII